MIRCRFLPISTLLLFLITTGCQDRVSRDAGYTVRDSAGIEIVESSAPLLGPDAWTISDEPVLQIGEVEGEDPYLFARIRGERMVFRMDDGRIVVCNGMDQTIRFFDSEGVFIKQTGGEGDGPGEFRSKGGCLPTDIGFVAYGLPRIVVWYDSQGDPVKTVRFPTVEEGWGGGVSGVFSDGSFLLSGNLSSWSGSELGPGLHTSTQDVFVVSPDGDSVKNLFTIGIQNNACTTERCLRQLFGPTGQLLPNDDGFFFGWPDSYEIGFADKAGRILRSIRRAWNPPTVSAEDRLWWEETAVEWHLDIMILPESHPAFDRLYVDRVKNLWVRHRHPRYDHPHEFLGVRFPYAWTWDVFDSVGRWMTTLTMPVAFEIHDIGEDYILGVWRDDWDVEYVRMYSLDRGG